MFVRVRSPFVNERSSPLWSYIQRRLDERGWSMADLTRHSGLKSARFVAWREGAEISLANAKTLASAFGVPVLEILVAAGLLTEDEAQVTAVAERTVPVEGMSSEQLVREIARRLRVADVVTG